MWLCAFSPPLDGLLFDKLTYQSALFNKPSWDLSCGICNKVVWFLFLEDEARFFFPLSKKIFLCYNTNIES